MTALRQVNAGSRRHLAALSSGQLHYRTAGKGPVVVLLSALPGTIAADNPLFHALAKHHEVVAVDPPGHGLSDAPMEGRGLAPFAEPLAALIAAFRCGPIGIVGEGLGATLALELADRWPDLVAWSIVRTLPDRLDTGPGWSPPVIDGTHLLATWDGIARTHLFRPATATRFADRVIADMPSPAAHHALLVDALRAGRNGERLRSAARAQDSDAILARRPAVSVLPAGADLRAALPAPGAVHPVQAVPAITNGTAVAFGKYLLDVSGGQLFARGLLGVDGLPLLGFHDQAGASRRLDAFVGPFLGQRPVLSIDMPGSGGSDPLLAPADITIDAYAEIMDAALRGLGMDAVDIVGRYSGGQTAVALALRRPDVVRHIVNAGVMIFDDADRAEHLAHYAPSLAPTWDGSHLVSAWMAFRAMNLWWPWYDRRANAIIKRDAELCPEVLQDRIIDALAAGACYRAAYHASFRYPMAERLRALAVPCLLTDIPKTASHARVMQAQAAAPNTVIADLSEDVKTWPTLLADFFAR